jgi:hypothetical protein
MHFRRRIIMVHAVENFIMSWNLRYSASATQLGFQFITLMGRVSEFHDMYTSIRKILYTDSFSVSIRNGTGIEEPR